MQNHAFTAPSGSRTGGLARSGTSARRSAAVCRAAATDRVKLGGSDLEVSTCCLGTMTWGKQNTEAEAHEQLSYAFDAGLNFLDTAEMYPVPPAKETQGRTDLYIGSWLKTGRVKREDVVIATKVSGYSVQNSYVRSPPETTRVTKAQIKASVDASLQRLGVDHVDLLQIHWPDRYVSLFGAPTYDIANEREGDVPFEEQLRGLEDVVKAGKVRYVGVSNETSYGVSEFAWAAKTLGLPKIQTIQNCYHLLCRTAYETDLAETCRRHDVSLLAYSPLAGGALSGKYLTRDAPKEARFNLFPGYMERYYQSLARSATEEYAELAKKHGLTPTQLALAWCRSRWFVRSTIIGATSLPQLKENLDAFSVELSPEVIEGVNQLYKKYSFGNLAALGGFGSSGNLAGMHGGSSGSSTPTPASQQAHAAQATPQLLQQHLQQRAKQQQLAAQQQQQQQPQHLQQHAQTPPVPQRAASKEPALIRNVFSEPSFSNMSA
ncbi:Aldo/keto reductase family [Monoraphidium neglectum]|uniref:Aldo/keto reductase family n=1 Tax=Monoraphidium neglectum TaxID=145388 RepID=A0A0D2NTB0_9CHLO|nr:Aldo/keto reductase family [Monoraphidium neglectum]KIZ07436.1 Aldo/keto reductase family [Monoraphidium neglectum]|eukprot:XP_013906455.1 Aldo/keto reductase family [Monoraphidium neglectum]